MMRLSRALLAASAASGLTLAVGAPMASADPLPVSPPSNTPGMIQATGLQFVPPQVASIQVLIGPVIIGGEVVNPGVNYTFTPPAVPWPPAPTDEPASTDPDD